MTELDGWGNFNVIVGSSAGALIGLQFVLITLIANRPLQQLSDAGAAFGTPTVVHFSVVLFLSAIESAPWESVTGLSIVWALVGLAGIFYASKVASNMKSQTSYHPVLEDWIFHAILPFAAYGVLLSAALESLNSAQWALFMAATGMLILLLSGIHNAWDAVTYSVFRQKQKSGEKI